MKWWSPGVASAVVSLIVNTVVMSVGLIAAGDDMGSSGRVQSPPDCAVTAPCEPPPEEWMVQPLPGQPGGGTWADLAPFAGDDEHPPHPGLVPSDSPPGYRVVYPRGWPADAAHVPNYTTR